MYSVGAQQDVINSVWGSWGAPPKMDVIHPCFKGEGVTR